MEISWLMCLWREQMAIKVSKNLEDVKDSRLFYEKDLPSFGYIMLAVITVFLIGLLIWSLNAHKAYLIKGSGTVVSDNKNYIMSDYTGKITQILIAEGDYVREGDTIFVIKSTDLELQKEQIEGKIKVYNKQIAQYEKLEKSIKDNTNYFSVTSSEDKMYCNQYLEYESKVAQNRMDVSQYKNYGYTDEQIADEIKKNEEKISEIYYNTLQTVSASVSQVNAQIEDLKVQMAAINNGKEDYIIKADTSGIVHMMADYKKGMVVQAAGTIGSIANENDLYYITSYIETSDMPLIRVGNDVEIAVSGLAENVYGTLPGKVVHIDSDVTTDTEQGKSYFKIKVEPAESYLISKSGNKVNISNGMSVETRVKYDEITYFQYAMEALGLLAR